MQATNRYGLSSYFIYSEGKLMAQDDKVWWHAKGDQKFGPYSSPQLKTLAAKGSIELTDLIWKEGLANWLPASSIKGLIPAATPAAPPPLPATTRPSVPVSNAAKPLNQKPSITAAQAKDRSTSIESDSLSTNPALWNPNSAANWSLLFSPIFGSYLHALNWRALNEQKRYVEAMIWCFVGIIVFILGGLFPAKSPALVIFYLVIWYFAAGRAQGKYVKEAFGNNYPRQAWGKPLAFAVVALIGYNLMVHSLRSL